MAFWLQKNAGKTPICNQNANLQPKRQFAARTPFCSQNANSTQLGYLQPKRQFAADCRFAAKTTICSQNASSLQICSQSANSLQICSQTANSLPIVVLQPKRQFAARTPIRCPLAAQTPVRCRLRVCNPNANLQPERQFAAHLQPQRQLADLTHFCSPNEFQQRKRMHPSTGCVPAHTVLNVLSEIIGAVRSCLPHNACFPDNRPCGVCGDASRLRPCQQAHRSFRARASLASPTTGPVVFAETQVICVPVNRPFGLFGHGHRILPR